MVPSHGLYGTSFIAKLMVPSSFNVLISLLHTVFPMLPGTN